MYNGLVLLASGSCAVSLCEHLVLYIPLLVAWAVW